ncbi:MAG TPA: NADP-dependent oxidoreductase [Patescibacteria group bacterium]|nr:NADP-dependent oxidoreductase [Patescibacteria group bacterium]
MKAAQISEYGDASVIKVTEVERPTPKDGQVVVEVYASSLNPFDSAVRSGYVQQNMPLKLPVTIGGDISGVVTEVGAGAEGFSVGDKVYGQANVVAGNSGAFAEYAATAAAQVAKAPSNLSFTEIASLPLVGVSALQALTQHINLRSGQKIFINGGAGGIGQVAIQMAKHIGAHIATTATGEEMDAVKALGADEIIDYKTQDFAEILSDYDAVFDTVGGELFTKTLSTLKQGGIAVSMAGQADEAKVKELGVTAISQFTHVTTDALNQLRELIESGVVKPNIGKVFSLEEIQEAFTARETGSVKGKVVLEIKK